MNTPAMPGPWDASYTNIGRIVGSHGEVIAECKKLTTLVELQARARLISQVPELFDLAKKLAALREGLRNSSSSAEIAATQLAEQANEIVAKAIGKKT